MSNRSYTVIPTITSPSYKLPLSYNALEQALRQGHGRALIHAARHEIPGDLLVHALTHNLRFDRQCEDAAQDWYLAMASRHQQSQEIFDQVIRRVFDAESSGHKNYIASTLAMMHRAGHPQALAVLYELTSLPDKDYSPPVPGALDLIEIEGEKGLLHALHTLASALPDTPLEPWMIHHYFYPINGDSSGECIERLAGWATSDSALRPLLDIVLGIHSSQKAQNNGATQTTDLTLRSLRRLSKERLRETPASVVIDLVRRAPEDDIGAAVGSWAMLAPRDALEEILSEALSESDPHRVHKYLRAFTERSPLHRFDERFAGWIDHPLEKLRWTAHHALATCPDPRIREIALQRLTNEGLAWGSIRLLQSTYQPGDHRAIESVLYLTDDMDIIHDIAFSLLDVFGQNSTAESLGSMLYVYEHGPCMNCRGTAVNIMQAAGVLPAWVREESRFDADPQIRKEVSGSEAIPASAD